MRDRDITSELTGRELALPAVTRLAWRQPRARMSFGGPPLTHTLCQEFLYWRSHDPQA